MKEYRDIIGKSGGSEAIEDGALGGIGVTSSKSLLQNEHVIEQALKRAKVTPQQLVQVSVRDKVSGQEIGDDFGGVGGRHTKQRPQTAQPKSLEGAAAIQAKQMIFFDGGGQKEAQPTKKAGKKPSRQAT